MNKYINKKTITAVIVLVFVIVGGLVIKNQYNNDSTKPQNEQSEENKSQKTESNSNKDEEKSNEKNDNEKNEEKNDGGQEEDEKEDSPAIELPINLEE